MRMPDRDSVRLPLIPVTVLRAHRVLERSDHRFRACARLLQAAWRSSQGLPSGTIRSRRGGSRRLGSMLSLTAGEQGRNFLGPDVAAWAKRQLIYRERGALIDGDRLFRNCLSSSPLAANLFAPLGLNHDLAAHMLRRLLPHIDLHHVLAVWLEHSPGRLEAVLTGDRTAFDVAVVYQRNDGRRGFVGFEIKYSEGLGESAALQDDTRLAKLAHSSALYKGASHAALRLNPMQQLFREHLLAYAAMERGDYACADFCLIAPRHNHLVWCGVDLYGAHLAHGGPVPFVALELEQVIEAFAAEGEPDYSCTGKCDDIGLLTRKTITNWRFHRDTRAGRTDARSAGNGSLVRMCAVLGWLLITLPVQTRHDRPRAIAGAALLMVAAALTGHFRRRPS